MWGTQSQCGFPGLYPKDKLATSCSLIATPQVRFAFVAFAVNATGILDRFASLVDASVPRKIAGRICDGR